jgi:biotin carboxylase
MGVITIVTDDNPKSPAKTVSHKRFDINGLDVPRVVQLAREEEVDGVLVGVADILVSSYCDICAELNLPCYATRKIVDVFTQKDSFKRTCEQYGISGIPEYSLDQEMRPDDIARIKYPVMVKPVDNGGGVGMTVCYGDNELKKAVETALACSIKKRFIVEKYMGCADMGIYYTFKGGVCSASMVYDRYTSIEQPGLSRVCLGGTYPSKYIDLYYTRMHDKACEMFREMGIENGVLMLSAFMENETFYVYDTGFRLQGEAPHLLMKHINGFDQREMLVRFALTGSMGSENLLDVDDARIRGKSAATLWFLLQAGRIAKIEGLDEARTDRCVVNIVQRLYEMDTVTERMVGNEKQVLARLYIVCDSKGELKNTLKRLQKSVKVIDSHGENMLLNGFDVDAALPLST